MKAGARRLVPIAVALLAVGALAALLVARAPRPAETFLVGGIQVDEPDHDRWLAALDEAEMNTVAVTVYARQADWDGDGLTWNPSEEWVVREIRAAERRGLSTALVLRVALDHAYPRNRFLWHGMIQPRGDAELASWFERYAAFAAEWAAIAEREGVDLLAVASELSSLTATVPVEAIPALEEYYLNAEKRARRRAEVLEHRAAIEPRHLWVRGEESYAELPAYLDAESEANRAWAAQVSWEGRPDRVERINGRRRRLEEGWRRVIATARATYRGRLTYAANFDQVEAVGFWDALDAIGINAYYPLRDPESEPSGRGELLAALEAGWAEVLRGIEQLRARRGLGEMPVVFTELGYTPRAGATAAPWAGHGFSVVGDGDGTRLFVWEDEAIDPTERALAVRALRAAHRDAGGDLLGGILYWKLTTRPEHREIEPFALVLGVGDPLEDELAAFAGADR